MACCKTFFMKMFVIAGSKIRKLSKFAWHSNSGAAPAPLALPIATPIILVIQCCLYEYWTHLTGKILYHR